MNRVHQRLMVQLSSSLIIMGTESGHVSASRLYGADVAGLHKTISNEDGGFKKKAAQTANAIAYFH